ncbi:uncharacterized protein TM35_000101820 [Trypanosoma theileri]|uniref:C2H2-type domain-containing protein n=1 Tax=Trypanosoma theileri TaxID=67003 RepID=A0A1X0NYZ0_9TRYP|nr:uncharacterized protein TM35_000101820 [Trypanosoma theileri]ORC89914.1 hypothetical protein TM35_000101820 [Trypanosoma theileri]
MWSAPEVLRPLRTPLYPLQKFHDEQGMPTKMNSTNARHKPRKTRDLPALVCPSCDRRCVSKSGLTLHRIWLHECPPTRAPPGQRDEREKTALRLLSRSTLHPLRM